MKKIMLLAWAWLIVGTVQVRGMDLQWDTLDPQKQKEINDLIDRARKNEDVPYPNVWINRLNLSPDQQKLYTQLMNAIKNDSLEEFSKLLNDKTVKQLINVYEEYTPLSHVASLKDFTIQRGDISSARLRLLQRLLDMREKRELMLDLNAIDSRKTTALSSAAEVNNVDIVYALLNAKILNDHTDLNINYQNPYFNPKKAWEHGKAALIYAIENVRTDLMQQLIDSGADVNLADGQGNTPLFHAARQWAEKSSWRLPSLEDTVWPVIKLLLDTGANIEHKNKAEQNVETYMVARLQNQLHSEAIQKWQERLSEYVTERLGLRSALGDTNIPNDVSDIIIAYLGKEPFKGVEKYMSDSNQRVFMQKMQKINQSVSIEEAQVYLEQQSEENKKSINAFVIRFNHAVQNGVNGKELWLIATSEPMLLNRVPTVRDALQKKAQELVNVFAAA